MEQGRDKEIPSIQDAGWSIEALGELAARGIVFDKVISKEDLDNEAKELLPEGLLDKLDDRPFMVFRIPESNEDHTDE